MTYYVYMLTNYTNSVLYVGVTNNLRRRVYQHKKGYSKNSFTRRYRLYKLVWFEEFPTSLEAIESEKKIKKWRRKKKEQLIESVNTEWRDLLALR